MSHQEEPKKTLQPSETWNLRLGVPKNPLQSRLFCKSKTFHKCLLYILGSFARGTKLCEGFVCSQREPYFSGEDMPQNSTQSYQVWLRGIEEARHFNPSTTKQIKLHKKNKIP